MNAIVAIGGAALFRVVSAYRAFIPSEVWVLGLKPPSDTNDLGFCSLESLLEPFMVSYFATEAEASGAAIVGHLTAHPLRVGDLDPQSVVDAVSETLGENLASVMALVGMLDLANLINPIELVLTDDNSASAHTAIAWARARGLPAVTLPDRAPLRRPPIGGADRTIVTAQRSRKAYQAMDFDESRLAFIPTSDETLRAVPMNERAARRSEAKAAFSRVLGWSETDILIVFELAPRWSDSALEAADVSAASLATMLSAFVVARARMPNLRLAVVSQPSSDGAARAKEAAAAAGVAAGDFAYTQADHEVWIAGADIVVSVDSTRSIEAATLGIPAVNLWGPASWYLGPAFAAGDGVIAVLPEMLGGTLVALAGDAQLRVQIASIACNRIAGDATASATAVTAIAGELAKLRRPRISIPHKPKLDIVIWAPDYSHGSAGLVALYRLCHLIHLAGGEASMYPGTKLHPSWHTPRRYREFTDQTVVVVPEIVNVHPSVKRVVRWVLNVPGLLGGPKSYGPDEMVFYYMDALRAAAQAATAEILTAERELQVPVIDPELFYNDRSQPRLYDCVFIYKGKHIYDRVQPREIRDAYVIQSGWPASRTETAALLRGCRRLYSFDEFSAIVAEGIICGAQVFAVRDDGEVQEVLYDLSDYALRYFDMSHVERFLRLVGERWE